MPDDDYTYSEDPRLEALCKREHKAAVALFKSLLRANPFTSCGEDERHQAALDALEGNRLKFEDAVNYALGDNKTLNAGDEWLIAAHERARDAVWEYQNPRSTDDTNTGNVAMVARRG